MKNQKKTVVQKEDVSVTGSGSVYLIQSMTKAGSDWIKEHIPEDAARLGDAVAVEHRYICDVIDG